MSAPTLKQANIVGVTSICTDLNILTEQVGKIRFGQTGYAILVDQNADLLVHPDAKLLSGEKLTNFGDSPPVKNILEGDAGFFSFKDDNNLKWISHSTRLNNGWAIVILQTEAEFLANKIQFQELAFFLSLVLIVGTSALTFFLANRLIKPISDLSNAARNIAKGQFEERVELQRDDELGLLATSFNHMAQQVQRAFAQLQQTFQKLEKAKQEAISANRGKDRFLANISHEFRTPLNSVLGYARILQLDSSLAAEQLEQLKTIQQSGTYLLTLINDILDLAKSQTGKMELQLQEFDLSHSLTAMSRIVESEATEKGVQLKTQFSNLPPIIRADPKRLTQVLLNLLSNAIKFTSSGEILLKVSLVETSKKSTSTGQQKIRFEVIDTGRGISPSEQAKIFQPFEQAGELESRHVGTGLGLSISKQLVKLMGGTLQVKSKLGQGSHFWFETVVDRETTAPLQPQQPKIDQIIGYQGQKRKLLVVDDKPENRWLLAKLLEPIGFKILMAENGEQMFTMVEQERPDLICLDLFMPVKTGFTSLKQLQQKPEFKEIPVIILSACSLTPAMREYLNCDAFLSKPFEEEELLELLAKYLQLDWIYRESNQIFPRPSRHDRRQQSLVI